MQQGHVKSIFTFYSNDPVDVWFCPSQNDTFIFVTVGYHFCIFLNLLKKKKKRKLIYTWTVILLFAQDLSHDLSQDGLLKMISNVNKSIIFPTLKGGPQTCFSILWTYFRIIRLMWGIFADSDDFVKYFCNSLRLFFHIGAGKWTFSN